MFKKEIEKLPNENQIMKGLQEKKYCEKRVKINTTERKTNADPLATTVQKQIEKLKRQGHIEKAHNIDKKCIFSPAIITVNKEEIGENCCIFTKIEQNYHKKKGTNA